MNTMNVSSIHNNSTPLTWHRFSLLRILLGALLVTFPVVLTMVFTQHLVPEEVRGYWPPLLAALLCVLGYRFYTHKIERQTMSTFSGQGAGRELGMGALLGSGLFLLVVGVLTLTGNQQLTGMNGWITVLAPLTGMVMVSLFEEILFRGILLRNFERMWGSWPALVVTGLLFGLAHLPNAHAGPIAIGATVVAGLCFSAAYMVTRRLWLVVGMHFAWNTMMSAVFSMTTSGHSAKGLFQGRITGPDWLSGGQYGVEASLVTVVLYTLTTVALLVVAHRRGQFQGRAVLPKGEQG